MRKTDAIHRDISEVYAAAIRATMTLRAIHDEADHAIRTEAKKPEEIRLRNLREIKALSKEEVSRLKKLIRHMESEE